MFFILFLIFVLILVGDVMVINSLNPFHSTLLGVTSTITDTTSRGRVLSKTENEEYPFHLLFYVEMMDKSGCLSVNNLLGT